MSLRLGAAHPDVVGAFERGDQHVTQPTRYALREGFALAGAAFERMLKELDLDAQSIDHFLPSVSSMQAVQKLQPIFESRFGLRADTWRINLDRVGYLGGVTFLAILDEMARGNALEPGDVVCSFAEESSKWMCAGAVLRWGAVGSHWAGESQRSTGWSESPSPPPGPTALASEQAAHGRCYR